MIHSENPHFWQIIDKLVATANVVIDRPKGSSHPRYPGYTFPFDYGYLEGTTAADGQGIDVWIGSLEAGATAVVCTVDLVKSDAELKILLGCSPEEIQTIHKDHNTSNNAGLLILRPQQETQQ